MIETGPLRATVLLRSTIGPLPYQCAISLYRDLKRIDFKLTVDYGSGFSFGQFAKSGTGLFVRFPVAFDGKMLINQPFGVYDTSAAKQVTHDFAAIEQDGFGLAIVHRNTPCVFRDGPPAAADTFARAAAGRRPAAIRVQRRKLCRRCSPGRSVRPGAGRQHAAAGALAAGRRESSVGRFFPGRAAAEHCPFGPAGRGGRIQARFFETAGMATRARLRLPWLPSRCSQITLNEEKARELAVEGDCVEIELRPWEIVTLSAPQP